MLDFELHVDDSKINEAVTSIIVQNAVDEVQAQLFEGGGRYNTMRKMYRETVQSQVRDLIKKNADAIIEKAVDEAARIIARKALPKLLERSE